MSDEAERDTLINTITVTEDVKFYISQRDSDFRVCTTCGGPTLLSTTVKPPKTTDIELYVGDHIIYVSRFQAPYLNCIDMTMVRQYCDYI